MVYMRRAILLISLLPLCVTISNETLIQAFIEVFDIKDKISEIRVEPLQLAIMQLQKHGVYVDDVCNLTEDKQALILMQNARAVIEIELQDKQDWQLSIYEHGFHRQRSYKFVRFAVVECLLIVTIVALAYLIWKH